MGKWINEDNVVNWVFIIFAILFGIGCFVWSVFK